MGADTQVNLLLAAMDLNLVRLLRGAMNAGGPCGRGALAPEPRIEPRRVIHPEPRYEPRPVIHPTPRYESRPVLHPAPRLEPDCPIPVDPGACRPDYVLRGPLPPPWKMRPADFPFVPPPVIKLCTYQVDIQNKGSLLDLFM